MIQYATTPDGREGFYSVAPGVDGALFVEVPRAGGEVYVYVRGGGVVGSWTRPASDGLPHADEVRERLREWLRGRIGWTSDTPDGYPHEWTPAARATWELIRTATAPGTGKSEGGSR